MLSILRAATAGAVGEPVILFVTQAPFGGDFASVNAVFGNHQANTGSGPRGGDLYIRHDAAPFHAFNATFAFDPARVGSARARTAAAAGGAVLEVNSRTDGRVTVALASAQPIDPAKGAILEVVYELKGRDPRVGRIAIADVSLEE